MDSILYHNDRAISPDQFIDVLKRSTLGERRPIDDKDRIKKMLRNANILVTAWSGNMLIGVSRALSDFSYCCYLSDLAVDIAFQKRGIGKELVRRTQEVAGDQSTVILLSAPAAVAYYPKIGMEQFGDCFLIKRKK